MTDTAINPKQDRRIYVTAEGLRQLGARARGITLLPRQPSGSVLNGRHASRLRGRGLNFEELRGYLPGDDVRTIDWKVTARTGEPHVRVYTEERDRPTLLVVDQRTSMFFGSQVYMKSVIAAEAAALAAHRILAQGDRVGGIVFGDTHIAEHRPVRNRTSLYRLLNSIADANNALASNVSLKQPMAINRVLRAVHRIAKKNAMILIFSDFDTIDDETEKHIAAMAHSNDLILFNVADPMAEGLPDGLRLTVTDGELQAEIDIGDSTVRQRLDEFVTGRLAPVQAWSRKYGFPLFPLTTTKPAIDQILELLGHQRSKR